MPLRPLFQGWVECLSRQLKLSQLKGAKRDRAYCSFNSRGILGAHKIASSTGTKRSAKRYTEAARDDK